MISGYASQEVEKLRKRSQLFKRLKGFVRIATFLLVLALFGFAYFTVTSGGNQQIILPVVIVSWFTVIILSSLMGRKASSAKKEFKSAYKSQFVKGIIYDNLDNAEYQEGQGFSREQVKDFQLAFMSSIFHSEDYLRASYNGVDFEQSDVKIIQYRRKKTNRIFFKGRMMKIAHSKNQVSDVQIFSKNFEHRASSVNGQVMVYGGVFATAANTPGATRTEDAEFDKNFDVYAANEQDVFSLLTPSFIETLKRLKNRYTSVAFRFTVNEVYIAMGSLRDTFECDDDKAIDYQAEAKLIVEDINEIKMLIDALI